jgi:hypothetical protein
MKKIINIIMVVGTLGLLMPACSLEKYPTTQILFEDAFQTFEEAVRFRDGIYNELRRCRYGVFTQTPELMSDLFNASINFGNRGGQPHRLQVDIMNSYEVRDIWINAYGAIAQVNFFLDNIGNITPTSTAQENSIALFTSEAHYARAYLYSILASKFMYPYSVFSILGVDENTPELGLPLVSTFDFYERPGRATIGETFEFIMADIEAARADQVNGVDNQLPQGVSSSIRITRDAVTALEARVEFMRGNNTRAAELANSLIDDGTYPLVTSETALRNMWNNDNSTEDIFHLHVTLTSFGQATIGAGGGWSEQNMAIFARRNNTTLNFEPDFIPTRTVIQLYEPDDIRLAVFFSNPATQLVEYLFPHHGVRFLNKFPRNPTTITQPSATNLHRHRPKVHGIAEMYLIAAEATSDLTRLNELRRARGASPLPAWSDQELRNEWTRETIGEGFRIKNLRRWGPAIASQEFNGRVPQDPDAVAGYRGTYFTNRHVTEAQFYRLTLPIPAQDMRTNPNMRQTPSWVNPQ